MQVWNCGNENNSEACHNCSDDDYSGKHRLNLNSWYWFIPFSSTGKKWNSWILRCETCEISCAFAWN